MTENADFKIRISREALELIAREMHCELVLGEPDAEGFHTPTLKRSVIEAKRV